MTDQTLKVPNADRLAYLVALAAIEAPERRNKWATAARVRWSLIDEIRAELEKAGFDWRAACRKVAAETADTIRSGRP